VTYRSEPFSLIGWRHATRPLWDLPPGRHLYPAVSGARGALTAVDVGRSSMVAPDIRGLRLRLTKARVDSSPLAEMTASWLPRLSVQGPARMRPTIAPERW
jgi:hypothetical protein